MSNEVPLNAVASGITMPCEAIVLDVPDVVRLEQAIAAGGTSLATLMERAGAAIAREVERHIMSDGSSRPYVVVLAGTGNNGGDGWVAADLLAQVGCEVVLVTSKPADALSAEPAHTAACAVMERAAKACKAVTVLVAPAGDEVRRLLERADVVIDALLGTGFSGSTVREPMATWISLLNDAKGARGNYAADDRRASRPTIEAASSGTRVPYVVAADVPSGVSAQTGEAATPCVTADMTVTMIVAKPGLLAEAAASSVGTLVVDNLGITGLETRIKDDLGIDNIHKHKLPRCDSQRSSTTQNALLARF